MTVQLDMWMSLHKHVRIDGSYLYKWNINIPSVKKWITLERGISSLGHMREQFPIAIILHKGSIKQLISSSVYWEGSELMKSKLIQFPF